MDYLDKYIIRLREEAESSNKDTKQLLVRIIGELEEIKLDIYCDEESNSYR